MLETQSEALVRTLEGLKSRGYDYLKKITAIDRGDHLEVLYVVYSTETKLEEVVTIALQAGNAKVPTVVKLFGAADWYERELSEMFGIGIKGRNAKRLLLEEWEGTEAPLRKSFRWGRPPGTKGGYIGVKWQ